MNKECMLEDNEIQQRELVAFSAESELTVKNIGAGDKESSSGGSENDVECGSTGGDQDPNQRLRKKHTLCSTKIFSAQSELPVKNIEVSEEESGSTGKASKKGHITIALTIMAIAGGGLVKLPTVAITEEAFYKVLYKAYPFLTLASFSLALFFLLISSGMLPNGQKFAAVAFKLMWLALAMELLALIIIASLIFII